MNNYTRTPRASRRSKKAGLRRTLLVVCMMLVVMVGSIAGTVAWLTAETDPVTNTFTVGDINIDLYEHEIDATGSLTKTETRTGVDSYKIIPGTALNKDPKVVVKANSEACWLFVKIVETNWNANMTYSVVEGWIKLDSETGVYYRKVDATTADTEFPVLTDNKVNVSSNLKKGEIKVNPTLAFTAYACQSENVADAATAWAQVKPAN